MKKHYLLLLLLFIFSVALNPPSSVRAFSPVSSLTFNTGESGITDAVIDPIRHFAYYETFANPATIVAVALDGFHRAGSLTLNSGETNCSPCSGAVIDPANGFAYFGGVHYGPVPGPVGEIVRVRLSNFTRDANIDLGSTEGYVTSAVIDSSGGYAYFGTNSNPSEVIKVRLSDFTRVGSLTLNSGEYYAFSAVIDSSSGYAYFGMTQGIVVKIHLSDLTRVGALTLNAGEVNLDSAAIDIGSGYAYFATFNNNPGIVVKIRLSDLTRVGALTFNSGENWIFANLIDSAGGYAYFGTYTFPGILVKVRLSDFTRVDTLTLPGKDYFATALFDPKFGYAYFGMTTGSQTGVVEVQIASTPSAPGGLAVTPGVKRVTLTWIPPASNGDRSIMGYKIYRSTTPGGETSGNFTVTKLGNYTTYTDTNLNAGIPYYYKISAYNNFGEGPLSIEGSATPSALGATTSLPAPQLLLTTIILAGVAGQIRRHRRDTLP